MKVSDLEVLLNDFIPLNLAQSWDNVGLQVGDRNSNVSGILISIDVTDTTIDFAQRSNCNLILSHHPVIFKPIKNIIEDTFHGRLISKLIKNNLAVYAAHTNLDSINWGVSNCLAKSIGLEGSEPIQSIDEDGDYKLVTFVPKEAVEKVRNVVCSAGAGIIGDYEYCTFSTPGEGTFKGNENTRPSIGEKDRLEKVLEERFEVKVPKKIINKVVGTLIEHHPYEEVAYDLIPLKKLSENGLGKIATLAGMKTVSEIIKLISEQTGNENIRVCGDINKKVKRVAVCGGSGSGMVSTCIQKGAELFISGEFSYHAALEAKAKDLILLEIGHRISEALVLETLKKKVRNLIKENGYDDIQIEIYDEENDVWNHLES